MIKLLFAFLLLVILSNCKTRNYSQRGKEIGNSLDTINKPIRDTTGILGNSNVSGTVVETDSFQTVEEQTSFPNPPPSPTIFKTFGDFNFSNYAHYKEITSYLTKILRSCGYRTIHYFSFEDGIAISTELQQIDAYGRIINMNSPVNEDILSTIKEWYKNNFTSSNYYYACVVLIVSPKIRSFNGNRISENEMKTLTGKAPIFPIPEMDTVKVQKDAKLAALLYQFESPANTRRMLLLSSENSRIDFDNSEIIKKINGY